MNKFVLALSLVSLGAVAAENAENSTPVPAREFTCLVTSDNKLYDDVFTVKVAQEGSSTLHYQRRYSCNPKDGHGPLLPVRGCLHAVPSTEEHRPNLISLQCRDDGQEGFIEIDPVTGVGQLYFYMPQIGYPERTELATQCTETLAL